MNSNFDKRIDRIGTDCIKWDCRGDIFGNPDLIPFSIADSDFATPDFILDALKERIDRKVIGYTELGDSYKESVMLWCRERHGFEVKAKHITSTAGILPAISAAIGSLLEKGERVLIQTPVYDPFESVVKASGCEIVYNGLKRDDNGRYMMDYGDLEDKLASDISMMIFCSPHNPVGRVWNKEELSKVLELCRKHDVILVSDEIHWDIIMPGHEHVSIASLINDDDKVILCTAPSKTFNIAGLEASNIIIRNTEIRKKFQGWLFGKYMFGANALGLCACEAAYRNGASWVDEQNDYIKANFDALIDYLNENLPKAVVSPLEGTYLAWIDLTYTGLSSDELVSLIAKHGAGLNSGVHYGKECDGFVRMNIACPRDMMMEGLNSILQAVNSL